MRREVLRIPIFGEMGKMHNFINDYCRARVILLNRCRLIRAERNQMLRNYNNKLKAQREGMVQLRKDMAYGRMRYCAWLESQATQEELL